MFNAVCNASPLIFLAKIKKIDLLDRYVLFIPAQVESEILNGIEKGIENANIIIAYLKKRKIKSIKIPLLRNLPDSLGTGEKAVISLAIEKKIERVFMDESKARLVARLKGLKPKGTIGILWDAYQDSIRGRRGRR